jgi:L-alanine-DL-glutamate epimerase-like enolase superfamily enzyme
MPRITQAKALLVDLIPRVNRTGAIQSFKSQETIFVTLTDAEGTGYRYTVGYSGPSIIALLRYKLLPALTGRGGKMIEAICRAPLFTSHATAVGPIMSLALAAIDTALWDLRGHRKALPLHRLVGGAKSAVPLYSTEGDRLHLEPAALVEDAFAMREAGIAGSKIKMGTPAVAGSAAAGPVGIPDHRVVRRAAARR